MFEVLCFPFIFHTQVVDDALFFAAHFGRHTVLRMLLEHWDAESEEREQRLAEQGHVPAALDNVLAVALNYACSAGHLPCVRLLLEHGADPLHRDFVSTATSILFGTF